MAENSFIPIIKASGEIVKFDDQKLERSLTKAGASKAQIQEILLKIEENLYPGITTKKIYKLAFKMLHRQSKPLAARYKLKSAIMELGPSGFQFEKYIAAIFKQQGYSTQNGIIMQGQCVDHEVDVIAKKNEMYLMIECKYHNRRGIICDVKVPLYIKSRFRDIEEKLAELPENRLLLHEGWVVTNTRFSDDAIQYGNCAGLKLLGWDYPNKGSLNAMIEKSGLYPITCLSTLSKHEKNVLLAKNIVLCKEICDNPHLLIEIGISEARIKIILDEAKQLCHSLRFFSHI